MKDKVIIGIILFILIILLGVQQYSIWTNSRVDKDSIFLEKINKLELKLDSLNLKKDSIRTVIDSTHIKIITNEKHYQERVNTIMIASDSDNLIFFKDYIKNYENNK